MAFFRRQGFVKGRPSGPPSLLPYQQSVTFWEDAQVRLLEDPTVSSAVKAILKDKRYESEAADVYRVAKDAKASYLSRQRTRNRRSGSEETYQAAIDRVILAAGRFSEVIDSITSCDPTHYARLAWGGVKIFLIAAQQNIRLHASVLEGMRYASELITETLETKIKIFFINQPPEMAELISLDPLRDSLIRLYISILRYLGLAAVYFKRGSIGRASISLIGSENTEIEKALREVKSSNETVQHHFETMFRERTNHEAEYQRIGHAESLSAIEAIQERQSDLRNAFEKYSERVSNLESTIERERKVRFLQWISPLPYEKCQKSIRASLLFRSGDWILRNDKFNDWLINDWPPMLWLNGPESSGKSYIACQLIMTFPNLLADPQGAPVEGGVIYTYCGLFKGQASSARAVVASLLRQVYVGFNSSSNRLIEEYYHQQEKLGYSAGEMDYTEVSDYLISAIVNLCRLRHRMLIVIDDFNRLPNKDKVMVMDTLEIITLKVVGTEGFAKIFITSQPEPFINNHFSEIGYLSITPERVDSHIITYLNEEIHRLAAVTESPAQEPGYYKTLSEEMMAAIVDETLAEGCTSFNGLSERLRIKLYNRIESGFEVKESRVDYGEQA